ncbi:fimbrial biogenesis chaperone [Pseudomonas sp. HLT2-19-2]
MTTCRTVFVGFFCRAWLLMVLAVGIFYVPAGNAGVMLNGTRIILNADDRNASTIVTNLTRSDYAVQVWVNDEKDDNTSSSPFIAMPALFKIRSGEEQVVRIIKIPGQLPSDRESVFYFNAQEIPVLSDGENNTLKVAIRTRVKVFYRPQKLPGQAIDAPRQLTWTLVDTASGSVLKVNNPTPYHVTFIGIRVLEGTTPSELEDVDMVAPNASLDLPLGHFIKAAKVAVEFSFINDYGGYSDIVKSSAVR